MIPIRLTARPTSTMTMRPPTLEVAPRLKTLIKKPSNVTIISETSHMKRDLSQTVREIAIEHPTTVRVFESLGIDYCCGGKRSARPAEFPVPISRVPGRDRSPVQEESTFRCRRVGCRLRHDR